MSNSKRLEVLCKVLGCKASIFAREIANIFAHCSLLATESIPYIKLCVAALELLQEESLLYS